MSTPKARSSTSTEASTRTARERMSRRRFEEARSAGLEQVRPARASCAFYLFIRVMEITDILSQNVPLEDVQYLAGHSNPSGHTDI